MSTKCGATCRPTPCFYGDRQLVMSLKDDNFYGREVLHFPCGGADCAAARLCEEEKRKRERKPQILTGDAEVDAAEAELRAILRKSGLNY